MGEPRRLRGRGAARLRGRRDERQRAGRGDGSAGSRLYALLFHPEVAHTDRGLEILRNFAFDVCGCTGDWTMASFIDEATARIRAQVGDGRVVCGLSGGVDSTVAALLIHRAIGDRLTCIFVDNGVLRLDEARRRSRKRFERLQLPLRLRRRRATLFLDRLAGVTDPEQKRKIIGATFIDVFEDEATKLGDVRLPGAGHALSRRDRDRCRSSARRRVDQEPPQRRRPAGAHALQAGRAAARAVQGRSARGRAASSGLDEEFVVRQPFPGPGLAVRILGEVTRRRLDAAAPRRRDRRRGGAARPAGTARLWQCFAVLLPVQSVGVMGDARTYEYTVAIRAVESRDGMTADWARLPHDLLAPHLVAHRQRSASGINRVVYDISSKPPSTIEWE